MIYKDPGIYKGPGLYKGASLYNGDFGIYQGNKNSIEDVIVCTYFKKTPVGNDLYQFNYDPNFIETTITINGIVYPSMRLNYFGTNINAGNTIDITNYSVVSLDFFIYPHISNMNDYVQFYGLRYFTRYVHDGGPSIRISIDDTPGNPPSLLGFSVYDSPIHMAFVYDRVNGFVTSYIDGNKKKKSAAALTSIAVVRCFGQNNTSFFDCTQWTLRNGDKSINGGENFPVPTEPYFNFS